MDLDPAGPKTYGSYGSGSKSGSATLQYRHPVFQKYEHKLGESRVCDETIYRITLTIREKFF
jgi:hypothetical protein